jgi:hypothetical protein
MSRVLDDEDEDTEELQLDAAEPSPVTRAVVAPVSAAESVERHVGLGDSRDVSHDSTTDGVNKETSSNTGDHDDEDNDDDDNDDNDEDDDDGDEDLNNITDVGELKTRVIRSRQKWSEATVTISSLIEQFTQYKNEMETENDRLKSMVALEREKRERANDETIKNLTTLMAELEAIEERNKELNDALQIERSEHHASLEQLEDLRVELATEQAKVAAATAVVSANAAAAATAPAAVLTTSVTPSTSADTNTTASATTPTVTVPAVTTVSATPSSPSETSKDSSSSPPAKAGLAQAVSTRSSVNNWRRLSIRPGLDIGSA